LRLSNHGFKADPEYRPSSRAVALQNRSTAKITASSDVFNETSRLMVGTDDVAEFYPQITNRCSD